VAAVLAGPALKAFVSTGWTMFKSTRADVAGCGNRVLASADRAARACDFLTVEDLTAMAEAACLASDDAVGARSVEPGRDWKDSDRVMPAGALPFSFWPKPKRAVAKDGGAAEGGAGAADTLLCNLGMAEVEAERGMGAGIVEVDGPAPDLARPDANVLTLSMP